MRGRLIDTPSRIQLPTVEFALRQIRAPNSKELPAFLFPHCRPPGDQHFCRLSRTLRTLLRPIAPTLTSVCSPTESRPPPLPLHSRCRCDVRQLEHLRPDEDDVDPVDENGLADDMDSAVGGVRAVVYLFADRSNSASRSFARTVRNPGPRNHDFRPYGIFLGISSGPQSSFPAS